VENPKQAVHQWSWLALLLFLGVGIFYPAFGVIALVCMLAPVAVAFFQGRSWCGWYCPRGSFNDVLLAKISFKGKVPAFFRSSWFRLTFLTLLLGAFTVQIILAWGNPPAIGRVFVRMIIVTTLVTLALGLIYQPRTWCHFCPMGTLAHYVTKWRSRPDKIKSVTFQKNACSDCKLCSKNCPINIDVYSFKEQGQVSDPDCLKCQVCVAKCPKKALTLE
jgi:ferredoxin-type protein NapH